MEKLNRSKLLKKAWLCADEMFADHCLFHLIDDNQDLRWLLAVPFQTRCEFIKQPAIKRLINAIHDKFYFFEIALGAVWDMYKKRILI